MDNNRQGNNNRRPNSGGMFQAFFGLLIAMVIGTFVFNVFSGEVPRFIGAGQSELTYDEFVKKIEDGSIYRVRIGAEDIYAYEKYSGNEEPATTTRNDNSWDNYFNNVMNRSDKSYHITRVPDDKELVERILKKGNIEIVGTKGSVFVDILISLAPFLLLWILIGIFARRMTGGAGGIGNIFSAGQSKAHRS